MISQVFSSLRRSILQNICSPRAGNCLGLAMSFPTKDERKKCWDARDRYWECLDGTDEEKEKCLELRKTYEKSCPSQWVKHFDRKRTYLQFKERIEKEGVLSIALRSDRMPQLAFRGCPPYNEIEPIAPRHRVYRLFVSS